MNPVRTDIPVPALTLGLAGLLPFAAGALLSWFPGIQQGTGLSSLWTATSSEQAVRVLGTYGAVILSFLGGVRWGQLLDDSGERVRWQPLALSVVPSLIAWPALLLPALPMLVLLSLGFLFQYALDAHAVSRGTLPLWFGRLRLILTSGAVACLLVGVLAIIL